MTEQDLEKRIIALEDMNEKQVRNINVIREIVGLLDTILESMDEELKTATKNLEKVDENFIKVGENFKKVDRNFIKVKDNFDGLDHRLSAVELESLLSALETEGDL